MQKTIEDALIESGVATSSVEAYQIVTSLVVYVNDLHSGGILNKEVSPQDTIRVSSWRGRQYVIKFVDGSWREV